MPGHMSAVPSATSTAALLASMEEFLGRYRELQASAVQYLEHDQAVPQDLQDTIEMFETTLRNMMARIDHILGRNQEAT